MTRGRSRGDAVDGVLLLDNPAGLSSNQALQQVKRLLRARKGGHTGSLDPAATGMLPLCFGEATKVCAFLLETDKTYRVTARLGTATDTGDAEGRETASADVPELSADDWERILKTFEGESMQVPPMYSALKRDGRRLYELAHRGEHVERAPRPIRIDRLDLLEAAGRRLVFRVTCSKGTYVRVLVEDIARRAGTVAHTQSLHREHVAGFETAEMMDLPAARALASDGPGPLRARLMAPDTALAGLPAVEVQAVAAGRFRDGQPVRLEGVADDGLVRVYGPPRGKDFLGVGEASGGRDVVPKRVFARS